MLNIYDVNIVKDIELLIVSYEFGLPKPGTILAWEGGGQQAPGDFSSYSKW